MNVLIVFAHPEPKSLNGFLKDSMVEHLTLKNHSVKATDLFQVKFKSSADREDFNFYDDEYFDLQLAQQKSHLLVKVSPDIKLEQEKLVWADLIIFQFPMWWYSVPAPLKGYIDRVFSVGFAYGGKNALSGKKVMISTTTGAPKQYWTQELKGTIEQVFFPLTHGTFKMLGLRIIEPFVVYGTKRLSPTDKKAKSKELIEKILSIVN